MGEIGRVGAWVPNHPGPLVLPADSRWTRVVCCQAQVGRRGVLASGVLGGAQPRPALGTGMLDSGFRLLGGTGVEELGASRQREHVTPSSCRPTASHSVGLGDPEPLGMGGPWGRWLKKAGLLSLPR